MSSLHPVSGDPAGLLALLAEWEDAHDPEPLTILTSGSTGEPKGVRLSRRAMRASADATHARLGGPGQWLLNLPPTYVAGVQVLFRSLRAGTTAVVQARDAPLAEAALGMTGRRRYVSLVPTQLVRLLREDGRAADREALRGFAAVLVGGGPLDPGVRRDAERAGLRIVQTYGMSETCGGCVYDGRPLDGVEVRVAGDPDEPEVQLRGSVLFDGYDADPVRTEATLTRDGWLRTHDLGRIDDGVLTVLGRADDMIISGGVKVPAQAVAAMVARAPAVVEAAVVGVPDPEWGERVVAVVAARDPIALAALRDLVEPRSWAPRQLVVLPELPKLPNGKPHRVTMRRLAARQAGVRSTAGPR